MKFLITTHISNHIINISNHFFSFLDCSLQYSCRHLSYHSSIQWRPWGPNKNVLNQHLAVFWLETDTLLHTSLCHTNKTDQNLVGCLLDSLVYLFFLIQRHLLLVYCMNSQESQPVRVMLLCIFSRNFIEVNHYIQFFIFEYLINSFLHIFPIHNQVGMLSVH